MTINNLFEKAIKFMSNSIKNYTEPESLERWCHLAKTEVGYDKSGHSFGQVIRYRLKKIEELKGCSLMEKVRLAFIFSRRVSPGFLKILKDAKCVVELNDSRKITYFRSPDGDCVLQSDQDPNVTTRKFKGEPIQTITKPIGFIRDDDCEKAIKFISNGIKNYTEPENLLKWCELVKTEVGYDKSAEAFSQVIRRRLDKIEDLKGFSLMEKVRLVFLFSRPVSDVFIEILKDEQCVVNLDDKRKITYFRSEDRDIVLQSEHKKRNFKGKPCTEKKNTADLQVKIPHNVQGPPPPASPQSLPNPPEIDDVEITNGEKEAAPEEEKQEIKAPERKKEENRDTSTNEKSILNTEEDVDVMNESIHQEPTFDGRIDYDDMDIEEYPEFMVPANDESPNHHNKKHQNLSQENDSEESESEDEAPTNVSDCQNSEYSRIQNKLDEQELEDVTVLKQERSFDRKPEKRSQNSVPSENAIRVKSEEWDENDFTAPDAPEALNNPEDAKMNVLLLANNIGIIALYCSLEGVQKKASLAIEMIKRKEREMTLNGADFNSYIDSMLKSIKRSRNRYSRQTEKSLPLKTIYRHIKLSLILPFGPEVTGEALKIVDKEIEELGESEDEAPLETIRGNLEYLLNSSTGFWI
ncbi:hypothetical protein B9Z55_027793 [Caenorhabditis nigoni]|uniref:SPK domain-containing protein n=1 Tax=Caenorhabditis nigoni TaxID=1611254 RepID=A0A2G5SEQ9_9PELO|nr:hypothetical protein B9Z55_027793 [Caenorhabditis nigoni]